MQKLWRIAWKETHKQEQVQPKYNMQSTGMMSVRAYMRVYVCAVERLVVCRIEC